MHILRGNNVWLAIFFNDISVLVGYVIPNPFCVYICIYLRDPPHKQDAT